MESKGPSSRWPRMFLGLSFSIAKARPSSFFSDGMMFVIDPEHGKTGGASGPGYIILSMAEGEPDVTLRDNEGFMTALGTIDLVIDKDWRETQEIGCFCDFIRQGWQSVVVGSTVAAFGTVASAI